MELIVHCVHFPSPRNQSLGIRYNRNESNQNLQTVIGIGTVWFCFRNRFYNRRNMISEIFRNQNRHNQKRESDVTTIEIGINHDRRSSFWIYLKSERNWHRFCFRYLILTFKSQIRVRSGWYEEDDICFNSSPHILCELAVLTPYS